MVSRESVAFLKNAVHLGLRGMELFPSRFGRHIFCPWASQERAGLGSEWQGELTRRVGWERVGLQSPLGAAPTHWHPASPAPGDGVGMDAVVPAPESPHQQ